MEKIRPRPRHRPLRLPALETPLPQTLQPRRSSQIHQTETRPLPGHQAKRLQIHRLHHQSLRTTLQPPTHRPRHNKHPTPPTPRSRHRSSRLHPATYTKVKTVGRPTKPQNINTTHTPPPTQMPTKRELQEQLDTLKQNIRDTIRLLQEEPDYTTIRQLGWNLGWHNGIYNPEILEDPHLDPQAITFTTKVLQALLEPTTT